MNLAIAKGGLVHLGDKLYKAILFNNTTELQGRVIISDICRKFKVSEKFLPMSACADCAG